MLESSHCPREPRTEGSCGFMDLEPGGGRGRGVKSVKILSTETGRRKASLRFPCSPLRTLWLRYLSNPWLEVPEKETFSVKAPGLAM